MLYFDPRKIHGVKHVRTTDFIRGHSERLVQSAAFYQTCGVEHNSGCALGGVRGSSVNEGGEDIGITVTQVLMQPAVEIPLPT